MFSFATIFSLLLSAFFVETVSGDTTGRVGDTRGRATVNERQALLRSRAGVAEAHEKNSVEDGRRFGVAEATISGRGEASISGRKISAAALTARPLALVA